LKALTWNEEKWYFVLSANNFVSVFEVPHKKKKIRKIVYQINLSYFCIQLVKQAKCKKDQY
jgi:hypothetical protein